MDGEIISDLELSRYLGRELPRDPGSRHPDIESGLVNLLIIKLEAREARARGVKIPPALIQAALERRIRSLGGAESFAALLRSSPTSFADVQRAIQDQILVRRMYLQTSSGPISPGEGPRSGRVRPAELRAYFQAHRDRFRSPGRAHVALIEIRPEATESDGGLSRARTLVEKIRSGEDFAALAREVSRGPRADAGGDLGWIEAGHLDPRLEAFVFGTDSGAVSEPIRTASGGWWVVRVLESNPGEALPFEAVADRIADEIRSKRLTEIRRTVLRRLADEAVIEPPAIRRRVLERIETVGEPVQP